MGSAFLNGGIVLALVGLGVMLYGVYKLGEDNERSKYIRAWPRLEAVTKDGRFTFSIYIKFLMDKKTGEYYERRVDIMNDLSGFGFQAEERDTPTGYIPTREK